MLKSVFGAVQVAKEVDVHQLAVHTQVVGFVEEIVHANTSIQNLKERGMEVHHSLIPTKTKFIHQINKNLTKISMAPNVLTVVEMRFLRIKQLFEIKFNHSQSQITLYCSMLNLNALAIIFFGHISWHNQCLASSCLAQFGHLIQCILRPCSQDQPEQ
jgi:hypothetical protein